MTNRFFSAAAAGMLAVAGAPGANAQEAVSAEELAALKAQIQALQQKVEALEKHQAAEQATAPSARQAGRQSQTRSSAGDSGGRFTWKGDLRYRHEHIDAEANNPIPEQTRHRLRARFGFSATINESLTGTVRIATGGGNGDPRSTNQTLGDGWDRKEIALDLAYVDYRPVSGLSVFAGKMPMPWQRVDSETWDPDLTPEGIAVKYARGPFFGTAFGYALSERSSASDATLLGAQLGATGKLGGAKLTGAIGYFDVGAVEGQVAFAGNGCGSSVNRVFFNGSAANPAQGNTTRDVGGCRVLANDFNMVEVLAQAEFALGALPLVVFADFIQNQAANALDQGYGVGFVLGKANDPQTWQVSYVYQSMEADTTFGQFVGSDFGGGVTDVRGSVIRVGYAPAKNWTVNGTYFLNDRFVDQGTERDYRRLQLDLSYKF